MEIKAAAEFLASYLPLSEQPAFVYDLSQRLQERLQKSWYPQQPMRGSSFRAIKVLGGRLDPILRLDRKYSYSMLPSEFVLWIDPSSVTLKLRDEDNVHTIWNYAHGHSGLNAASLLNELDQKRVVAENHELYSAHKTPNTGSNPATAIKVRKPVKVRISKPLSPPKQQLNVPKAVEAFA